MKQDELNEMLKAYSKEHNRLMKEKPDRVYTTKDIEEKSKRLIGKAWANFQEQKWILVE